MKKTFLFVAIATLAFIACNEDNEFHQTYIPEAYQIVYADQTTDSVQYVTTEVHQILTSSSWCLVNNTYQQSINQQIAANKGIYQLAAYLELSLNTTGKLRTSNITIDGGEYSASTLIMQLGNLEVARPAVVISSDLGTDSVSTLNIEGLATTDSIMFHTNYPWELSVPEGSFITLTQTSGPAGNNTVYFTAAENRLEEARTEKIRLTSVCGSFDTKSTLSPEGNARITTIIPVKQAKQILPITQ